MQFCTHLATVSIHAHRVRSCKNKSLFLHVGAFYRKFREFMILDNIFILVLLYCLPRSGLYSHHSNTIATVQYVCNWTDPSRKTIVHKNATILVRVQDTGGAVVLEPYDSFHTSTRLHLARFTSSSF